jgi:hypothetical protein
VRHQLGGATALVEYLRPESQNNPMNSVIAVSRITSFSQTAVMMEGAGVVALNVFDASSDKKVLAASAWAIGPPEKHSAQQPSSLAELNLLSLLGAYSHPAASDDLKLKCKRPLKQIISHFIVLSALEPLLAPAPPGVQYYTLAQVGKLLRNSTNAETRPRRGGGQKGNAESRS